MKRHYSKLLFAALALIPAALLAQNLAPTPRYSDQAELSKVEEWVLSQGIAESIAPELAAILGLGSDRLPVKLKAFRTSDGINLAFAVSTNPKQEGIVISALKTMADKTEIYSVGTAWLTDRSGTLRQTIAVDGFGAKVLPNSLRAAKFKDIKGLLHQEELQATNPSITSSPSPQNVCKQPAGSENEKPSDKELIMNTTLAVLIVFDASLRLCCSEATLRFCLLPETGEEPQRAARHATPPGCRGSRKVGCGVLQASRRDQATNAVVNAVCAVGRAEPGIPTSSRSCLGRCGCNATGREQPQPSVLRNSCLVLQPRLSWSWQVDSVAWHVGVVSSVVSAG